MTNSPRSTRRLRRYNRIVNNPTNTIAAACIPIHVSIPGRYSGASWDRKTRDPTMPPEAPRPTKMALQAARFHWPRTLLAWRESASMVQLGSKVRSYLICHSSGYIRVGSHRSKETPNQSGPVALCEGLVLSATPTMPLVWKETDHQRQPNQSQHRVENNNRPSNPIFIPNPGCCEHGNPRSHVRRSEKTQ